MSDLTIDIAALVDRYIERTDDGFGADLLPDIYRVECDGEGWLTDRYWMLLESVCDLSGAAFKVQPLPGEDNVTKACGWINLIKTAELSPTSKLFAATFAGVLTLAGLSVYAVPTEERLHALVHGDTRVGVLMPLLRPDPYCVSVPVAEAVLTMYRQINSAAIVHPWQAWDLAAYLTSDAVRHGGETS